jgi:hypothetical protein
MKESPRLFVSNISTNTHTDPNKVKEGVSFLAVRMVPYR